MSLGHSKCSPMCVWRSNEHKQQVADIEMETSRTIEEITLIEQEMINYIVYYKNTALTKLND